MSERFYRLILGLSLMVLVYFQVSLGLRLFILLLLLEGITNLRVPLLISRIRYESLKNEEPDCCNKYSFEAERALRLIIAILLFLSLVMFRESLWFLPWFMGFALTMAGITGICPMGISLRKAGFR